MLKTLLHWLCSGRPPVLAESNFCASPSHYRKLRTRLFVKNANWRSSERRVSNISVLVTNYSDGWIFWCWESIVLSHSETDTDYWCVFWYLCQFHDCEATHVLNQVSYCLATVVNKRLHSVSKSSATNFSYRDACRRKKNLEVLPTFFWTAEVRKPVSLWPLLACK